MNIGSFGFPADQLVKLEKMLKLSKNNRYVLTEFNPENLPDLLLVFGMDNLQTEQISALPRGYQSRLIVVSKEKPSDSAYSHLGYPLVSSRVVRTLDKMTSENEEYCAAEPEQDGADKENLFSKYEEQAETAHRLAAEAKNDRTGYCVLVVDDSQPMQQALAGELEKLPLPVSVDFADDGESALAKVADNHYDFLFLDIVMPGIDGFEACTRMRELPEMKKTPIIMLSSKNSPLDEVKGIMAGCSTYLTKPINPDEFQKVINRVSNWVDEFKKE
jgi:twitching motility two-component system response regulator PilG